MDYDAKVESIYLMAHTPMFLHVASLVFLLSAFFLRKNIIKRLSINIYQLAAVLLIASTSVFLTIEFSPKTSKIFYDEQIYMQIAQNISENNSAKVCTFGEFRDRYYCHEGFYNKQPNAFPYFLSYFFNIFGVSYSTAHLANYIAYFFTSIFLFSSLYIITNNYFLSIGTIIVYGTIPMNIIWANTISSEICTNMFISSILFSLIIYLKEKRSILSTVMLGSAISLGAQCRTEMIILPFIILGGLFLFRKSNTRNKHPFILIFTTIGLLTHLIVHLYVFRNDSWGSPTTKFSITFFLENLKTNGPFYLNNLQHPTFITFLMLTAVFIRHKRNIIIPALFFFITIFSIYTSFYAGSYEYGSDSRFAVLTMIPISIMAGIAMDYISSSQFWSTRQSLVMRFLCIIILLSSLVKYNHVISNKEDAAFLARKDIEYTDELSKILPQRALVFSLVTYPWLLVGISSHIADGYAQINVEKSKNDFPGGLYFYWGYWCNSNIDLAKACRQFVEENSFKKVKSYYYRGHEYSLYNYKN